MAQQLVRLYHCYQQGARVLGREPPLPFTYTIPALLSAAHTCTHIQLLTRVHTRTHTRTHVRTYIHTYIHTTHTYMHIHT